MFAQLCCYWNISNILDNIDIKCIQSPLWCNISDICYSIFTLEHIFAYIIVSTWFVNHKYNKENKTKSPRKRARTVHSVDHGNRVPRLAFTTVSGCLYSNIYRNNFVDHWKKEVRMVVPWMINGYSLSLKFFHF